MSNLIIMYMTVFIALIFALAAFSAFAIGFMLGYKQEDRRLAKRTRQFKTGETEESDKEKKAKKDWKNFLEYDGTVSDNRTF